MDYPSLFCVCAPDPTCCECTERWWSDRSTCSCVYLWGYTCQTWRLLCRRMSTCRKSCTPTLPQRLYVLKLGLVLRLRFSGLVPMSEGLQQQSFLSVPLQFDSGTPRPQMSSCFLLTMAEDSIEGIYDTLKQCALISKSAGGIGLSIHNIRASGSYIAGTNGSSNGIVPMLRVFNDTARYVDQGGGKRKGAFAVYLEPWHGDIFEFLDLRKVPNSLSLSVHELL
mgnify:CR=1 FL=1